MLPAKISITRQVTFAFCSSQSTIIPSATEPLDYAAFPLGKRAPAKFTISLGVKRVETNNIATGVHAPTALHSLALQRNIRKRSFPAPDMTIIAIPSYRARLRTFRYWVYTGAKRSAAPPCSTASLWPRPSRRSFSAARRVGGWRGTTRTCRRPGASGPGRRGG